MAVILRDRNGQITISLVLVVLVVDIIFSCSDFLLKSSIQEIFCRLFAEISNSYSLLFLYTGKLRLNTGWTRIMVEGC